MPRFEGWTPGPNSEGSGEKVVNLSNAPGCRPDFPIALRKRSVETMLFDQPRPWLGTMEIDAFG